MSTDEQPRRLRVEDATFVELMDAARSRAETRKLDATSGEIAREFAITMTLLEDAQMRYTRGVAMALGVFRPIDLESADAVARVEEARRTE